MKHLNMEKAIKRYNDIMMDCGWEHGTIGTSLSENTENWNLRDMVAEADYLLSCYYESGHCRFEDKFLGEDNRRIWLSETGKLSRFINTYKKFINNIAATEGHCSQYD